MRLPGQADVLEDMMLSTDHMHGLTNAYWPADRSEPVLDQTIGEALREAASRYGSHTAHIDGARGVNADLPAGGPAGCSAGPAPGVRTEGDAWRLRGQHRRSAALTGYC
jgi:hypothetical protein